QQLILLGVFFVLPVYLQVVLGLDAFETGKRLFPMSISMLVAALLGPRLAARGSPKRTAQLGLGALVIGSFVLLGTIDVTLETAQFSFGLALFGIGAGLLVSQLGNIIISSVPPDRTNEAGGLQGTAQNLGASLGTALIGAVLLTGLTNGFVERVQDNPALPQSTEAALTETASKGLDAVPVEQVEQAALDAGLPSAEATAVADAYGEAELDGLRNALFAVAAFGVLAFWPTRKLPGRATEPAAPAEASPGIAPAA
ncbi:MAG: MFS transporter, partial [Gaiellaceae bacterium]